MFRNYLKIAWRNLLKRKGNTLINILGLSSGMAICLLLLLYVKDERSFDDFQERKDKVFRLALERRYPGRSTSYSMIPQSIGEAVQIEFPEVKECVRIFSNLGFGSTYVKVGDKVFEEKNAQFADSGFFRVFSGMQVAGDLMTALDKPNSMVLNERTAVKYFGSTGAALGKNLNIEKNLYVVTGVCKDWPPRSHFDFDLLISSSSIIQPSPRNYINFSAHTYLLLADGADPSKLEAKLPLVVEKYVSGQIEQNFGQTFEQFKKSGNGYRYFLQPLGSIHLGSDLEAELKPNGSERAVSMFMIIATFILAIACVNFINLSTARSIERAREVGIRKTFGSLRGPLMMQFLMESVLTCMIALFVALVMVQLLLPSLNALTDKHLGMRSLVDPLVMVPVLLAAVIVGILAGWYPASVLSAFKPIKVLKGKLETSGFGLSLRNALVVFQFAISVILIVSTLVVHQQMEFMTGDQLGFKKDLVMDIERTDQLGDDPEAFKAELRKLSGVHVVSGTTALPGSNNFFGMSFQKEGSTEAHTGRGLMADEGYDQVLSLQMAKGRFFSKAFSTDTTSIVLNERAVAELGLTGDPIGAHVTSPDDFLNPPGGKARTIYSVIGVVKDFHFQSLHEQVAPLFLVHVRKVTKTDPLIAVKLAGADHPATIAAMERIWKTFVPDRPFRYAFLDQTLAEQYRKESTTQKLFMIFSVMAILIACLGLLGLIAYSIQMRVREIGIRKVLGASVPSILWLLGKNLLRTVLVAGLIAIPVAWWAMHRWLQGFVYRINIGPSYFIIALCATIFIACATISFQAIRAAIANPTKSLRSE